MKVCFGYVLVGSNFIEKTENMKYIITLISVFTFFNSFSQTQEQIYQFKYEMSKEFIKQPNYKIIYKEYKPDDIYIKTKSEKGILQNSADAYAEKANITIEKKDNNQVDIILNSQFPSYLKEELFGLVKLNSVKSNLFNSKMDKVELSKSSFNNLGGKFKNDSNTELEYQTIQNQKKTRKIKEEIFIINKYVGRIYFLVLIIGYKSIIMFL